MLVKLVDLAPGDIAVVRALGPGDRSYRQQLLAMGLTPNTRLEVLRRAPLGDPILIKVRDFMLSLRRREAALLQLERVT